MGFWRSEYSIVEMRLVSLLVSCILQMELFCKVFDSEKIGVMINRI